MSGKVLVVMSSAKHLDLRDGKQYPTGFYLNEFAIPFRKLIEAGYTPVVANPNGDRLSWTPTLTMLCSSVAMMLSAPRCCSTLRTSTF